MANIRRPEKVEEESSAAKKYKSRGWVRVLKHGQKPKRRRAQRKRV